MLDDEQIERIHTASLQILEQIGVEVLDDAALAVFANGGAEVDWSSKRVRLPRGLVEDAVSSAPSRFRLRARNPRRDIEIGGDDIVLIPTGGPAMVADLDHGRRHGTFAEQLNFVKLCQHSRLLDTANRCVEAQDLPVATRHLDYLYAAIRYTDKPLVAPVSDRASVLDSLALAGLLFDGFDGLRERPGTMIIVNVDSPLRFGPTMANSIVTYARAGQPVQITPFILPGMMSPVTAAGAVAQQNAENLAGITLVQLAAPGAPVVYGSFATQSDMRTAAPLFGGGESLLMEVAAGQLATRYGVPHRGMGLVTTAHAPDAHSAWEKMNCLWGLVMSQTHVIVHAAGWLEGGLTASYEQFVLDLEMLEGMSTFTAGVRVDEESLALDTIGQVGPGGSYMLTDHTLANFRLANYLSSLVDSRPHEVRQSGSRSLLERANSIWKGWLSEYEEPRLDPALHEAVRDYVVHRQRGDPAPALLR